MWFLRFVCGAFVWFAGVCVCTQTQFYARDDAHGPEVPDTAPGLPVIPLVPFNGNDSMPSSPPTYPSPNTTTRGYWDEPVRRARETVSKMNVSDLVTLVTGSGYGNGLCVGNIAPIPSIEFPGLCLQDSPLGLRGVDLATAFPPAITAAATFSKQLMYERGVALAEEFRDKGVNVFLGPMINVIRAPAAGRNWEGFGADPYVNGEGAYQTVLGVQSKGVQAVLKHYIANEQEHFRNTGSSNLDERTEREIYLHPFLRGIQAGAVSVMASYNFVNNTWMTQNPYLLNGRLKTELGFQGYVMSDWGAHHSGVASANAGLDMTMPGGTSCCELNITSYWGANLTQAVTNSSVPLWRVQDMATRILAAYYFVHQDEGYPKPNFNFFDINDPATNGHVNVMRDHHLIAREVATAGTVLLKNVNQTLPLRQPKKLVMIGSDAGPFRLGAHHYPDQIGWPYGPLGMGWGSGTAVYSYMISPYEAIQRRARADNTAVDWSFDDFDYGTAQAAANYTDAALVFVTSNSGEAYGTVPNVKPVDLSANMGDRNNLTLWNGGEELIKQVAAVNNNTIVVVHAVGPVTMEDWIDHPNVTAVVWANLPSSENGNALVNILYGTYNPSGRLPYTIARRREDYSADVLYNDKAPHPQINYTEQLGVDYRWFDSQNIAPRFEFGFGLSYTNFTYDDLHIDTLGATSWNDRWQGAIASDGLPDWLFDDAFKVHFNVSNTGGWDGFEVPQVYVGFPPSSGEPPRVLRAFDRVWVPRNQTTPVSFTLNYYDLSVWNATHQQWRRPEGDISVFVGASSRDLRLNTTLPSM